VTDIATIVQAAAIVSACWAIISGVGAWKREFVGKRRIELAEQVLAKFFEVKDSIAFIRNPFSHHGEGNTRERGKDETSKDSDLLDRGYIVVERYQKREPVFSEFNTLKYRCMASFGPETEAIFGTINKALNSIFHSARILTRLYWRDLPYVSGGERYQRHLEEMHRFEKILWDTGAEDDEIRLELQEAQKKLEAVTAPCFEEPISLYTFLTKRFRWGRAAHSSTKAPQAQAPPPGERPGVLTKKNHQ